MLHVSHLIQVLMHDVTMSVISLTLQFRVMLPTCP